MYTLFIKNPETGEIENHGNHYETVRQAVKTGWGLFATQYLVVLAAGVWLNPDFKAEFEHDLTMEDLRDDITG